MQRPIPARKNHVKAAATNFRRPPDGLEKAIEQTCAIHLRPAKASTTI
jgi:hypothetical protein